MLTDILYYKIKDETQRELLEIILRNAKRLKLLSDNLLDITKIETRSLNLNKKFFNLKYSDIRSAKGLCKQTEKPAKS
jgi:signal transduction histidine kinase